MSHWTDKDSGKQPTNQKITTWKSAMDQVEKGKKLQHREVNAEQESQVQHFIHTILTSKGWAYVTKSCHSLNMHLIC